jgi:alpha-tubulin suppressor-like RCC1 family protein
VTSRKTMVPVLLALGLIVAVIFNSCQNSKVVVFETKSTTTVGNPMTDSAEKISLALCGTVSRCRPEVSLAQCENSAKSLSFSVQLGLSPADFPTLAAVILAEEAGVLSGNEIATNACYSAINSLSCSDPYVQAAYDPAAAEPFAGLPQLIPSGSAGLCDDVFTPTGSALVKVSHGGSHSCGVTRAGAAYCWGGNTYGQLGNNSTVPSTSPVAVTGLDSGVRDIVTGSVHTCALVNGGVMCWGRGMSGGLGNGSGQDRLVPTPAVGLDAGVTALAAGLYSDVTCAVHNGAAKCWGGNNEGELGIGTKGVNSPIPVQVTGLTSGVFELSIGAGHVCAVTDAGVKCWGMNVDNQLGATSGETCYSGNCSTTPLTVAGIAAGSVQAIAAGFSHTCVLISGGVKCWGSINGSASPQQITGFSSTVTAIDGGEGYSCVSLSDQTMQCWGANIVGQLGDGTQGGHALPSAVANLSGVLQFSSGALSSCAVTTSGIWCWGRNSYGENGPIPSFTCPPNGPCNLSPQLLTGAP